MLCRTVHFPEKQRAALATRELPAMKAGDLRVRTTVSLVSTGTESFCYRGLFEPGTTWAGWVQYPFYPGYSAVGVVEEVGKEAAGLAAGDRVYTGQGHSDYAIVPAASVVPIPDAVDDESASWATLSFITQTAVRRAEHSMGDTAAVIGLGPLGQLVTQYLRVIGLRRIMAIDTVQARLDAATAHGATDAFLGSAADAGPFVAGLTDGQLADVVYDVTGHWAVLPLALKLARQFGKTVLLGDSPEPTKQHLTQDVLARQVTIIGSHNAKLQPQHAWWTIHRQISLFLDYVARGQMRVSDLITHRFKPEQAGDVYRRLLERREDTLGVVFDWR